MKMPGFEHYTPATHHSISSLDNGSRCPRLGFYSKGVGLVESGGPHIALKFGEAIHAAIPQVSVHQNPGKAVEIFNSIFKDQPFDEKRNSANASMILAAFAADHRPGFSLYNLLPPPATDVEITDRMSDYEIPFALDIETRLPIVGRIDGLARHRDTNELWGVEYKTSRELSERFMLGFRRSPQVIGYTMALRVYTQEPIRGVMIEGIRVSKKNTETMLHPFYVNDVLVEDFILWARIQAEALEFYEKEQDFPKWLSGCNPYTMFGEPGYSCKYSNLCDVQDWTTMMGFFAIQKRKPFSMKKRDDIPKAVQEARVTLADVKPIEVPTGIPHEEIQEPVDNSNNLIFTIGGEPIV